MLAAESTALALFLPLCTVFFGLVLGLCELVGRYRDAPFDAIGTPAARAYIMINGLASGFAYFVILQFGWNFGITSPALPLVQAFAAGFGSMAVFRSSLLNVKIGETDVDIGPGFVFQIILFATDRAVDRLRGEKRSSRVAAIMKGASFLRAQDSLPNYCFELLQNVPIAEQQSFRQAVGALASLPNSAMNDSIKALNLGLMLMNSIGDEVLEIAVNALGPGIQGPSALELPILGALQNVDFAKMFPTLVDCCFLMSNYGTPESRQTSQAEITKIGTALQENDTMDNATKVTMLALALQQRIGDGVLFTALGQLSPSLNKT